MANAYKSYSQAVGTSFTTIVTGVTNSTIVMSMYFANVDGVNEADVSIQINDGGTVRSLGDFLPVPINATYPVGSMMGFGKFVLESGDLLQIKSTNTSDVVAYISVLEMT